MTGKKTNFERGMVGSMNIPYGRQWIDEEDIQAVEEVLRSDFLTTGPKVGEFERTVADYCGVKYAVAFSSGTAALHGACHAAGIGAGDEVITTPITFAASANCVLYQGGTPVFADIDARTCNIDPGEIERKLTPATKAIIPVHYTGQPCDLAAIHAIAKKHRLMVIEDAAHALGAIYQGKRIGGLSDMTILSFHPVKHITTGEGGMVLTNDSRLYERLVLFHSHGITRDQKLLSRQEGGWYYEQQELGYHYRMTDIQSALGISQMKKLPQFLERRRFLAERYTEALAGIEGLTLPYQSPEGQNAWHLYAVQVPPQQRREIFEELRAAGIMVNVHYVPVYTHPYYREHGYMDTCCPAAEQFYAGELSLPLYPGLTEEQQDYVIETLTGSLQKRRKADR